MNCDQCEHIEGGHVFVRSEDAGPPSGIVLCPVPECQCFGTWSIEGSPPPVDPFTEEEVESFRTQLQAAQNDG